MWGSEVPLASVATDQSTSDGWSGQGGSRQGQISSIASHEAGLCEGSPGGSFLAGQYSMVEPSPLDHLFMHSHSPWRNVPRDLQMHEKVYPSAMSKLLVWPGPFFCAQPPQAMTSTRRYQLPF